MFGLRESQAQKINTHYNI